MITSCRFCATRKDCPVWLDLIIETENDTELDKAAFFQGNNCDSFEPESSHAKSKKHR